MSSAIALNARQLTILWSDDAEQWTWLSEGSDQVAKLNQTRYLMVYGSIQGDLLELGKSYEVTFQVKALKVARAVDNGVTLTVQTGDGGLLSKPDTFKPNSEWQELKTKVFELSEPGEIVHFYLVNDNNSWKKGILIKGVKITGVP